MKNNENGVLRSANQYVKSTDTFVFVVFFYKLALIFFSILEERFFFLHTNREFIIIESKV